MDETPWTPVEAVPDGGWPPAPDAVPVIVTEWAPLAAGAARPHLPTTGGSGVSLKHDRSLLRARRFAEAWRWLRHADAARLTDPETLEWLYASEVLVPVRKR